MGNRMIDAEYEAKYGEANRAYEKSLAPAIDAEIKKLDAKFALGWRSNPLEFGRGIRRYDKKGFGE